MEEKLMKKLKKLLIIGIIFIVGGQLAACNNTTTSTSEKSNTTTGSSTVDPITGNKYPSVINIGVIEGGPESAILIKEKYLENLGVKVNIVNYAAGTAINNSVVSGNVDLSSYGSSPIALGISNGIGYKAVFVPYIEGGNIEALAVKSNLGVKTVADLKGKRIATAFGTTSHYALLNALRLGGVSPSDVTLLDMSGTDIVAAWTRGDIDATYIWSPALDNCVKANGTIITNDGALAKQDVTIPEIGIARTDFAKKYPTLVNKYVKALSNVYDLVKSNPDKAIQDVADWEGITKDNAKGQITDNQWISGKDQLTANYLGTSNKKGKLADTLKTIADFHKSQGDISKSPDIKVFQDAIDTSYAEEALKIK
jgi:taurine transport system substrate-binding protein